MASAGLVKSIGKGMVARKSLNNNSFSQRKNGSFVGKTKDGKKIILSSSAGKNLGL